jgi:hypothetical protein
MGIDLFHMWAQMGWVAKAVAFVLFIMSFWSVGVAVERIYTFSQARKQSKLYAPQVAKHLKAGEAVPLQPPRQGGARRPAGVPVPARLGWWRETQP